MSYIYSDPAVGTYVCTLLDGWNPEMAHSYIFTSDYLETLSLLLTSISFLKSS